MKTSLIISSGNGWRKSRKIADTIINLLVHPQCDKMMFDEESKRRTSEYIFGAEPKKPTPARKSKVRKELKIVDVIGTIATDSGYMAESIGAMIQKLRQMDNERHALDFEDTVDDEAMWRDFIEFYKEIADKLDNYIEDMNLYMGSLKEMSKQMHENYEEMKDL